MRHWDSSGTSWTICKQSAPCSIQITKPTPHHSIFTGQILFLTPNKQCYSIEGTHLIILTQSKYQWRSDLQSEVNNLNGDEESYQLEQAVPYWCQKLYSALIKTSEGVQQNETSTDSWRGHSPVATESRFPTRNANMFLQSCNQQHRNAANRLNPNHRSILNDNGMVNGMVNVDLYSAIITKVSNALGYEWACRK